MTYSRDFANAINNFARALDRKYVRRDDMVITVKPHAFDNLVTYVKDDENYLMFIDGDPHKTTDEITLVGIKFIRGKD